MTIRKLYIKEFGEKSWKKVSPRLKKLFLSVDALAIAQKPITPKQLKDALS